MGEKWIELYEQLLENDLVNKRFYGSICFSNTYFTKSFEGKKIQESFTENLILETSYLKSAISNIEQNIYIKEDIPKNSNTTLLKINGNQKNTFNLNNFLVA